MKIAWRHIRASATPRGGRHYCEPGWCLGEQWWRSLNDYDLWLVYGGRGRMELDGQPLELRAGVCFWMRPGHRYEATHDPKNRLRVNSIHFVLTDEHAHILPFDVLLPPQVHEVADVGYAVAVTGRIVDLIAGPFGSGDPRANQTVADALLTGLLMDLDAASDHGGPRPVGTARRQHQQIMEMVWRIDESPTDVPTVAELARAIGYSPDHFARLFRSIVGQSPQSYIVQARINRARLLLTESSLSVSQIADMLGYQDVYFFSRQFKTRTGESPTEYRRRVG